MEVANLLRTLIRTVHVLSATAWIGGSIFYLVALAPNLRGAAVGEFIGAVNRSFGGLVQVCIWLLLASGVIMVFDRLSEPQAAGALYPVVLAIKVVLSIAMFLIAGWLGERAFRRRRPRATPSEAPPKASWWGRLQDRAFASRVVLALGVIVFALGALLTALFETGLRQLGGT